MKLINIYNSDKKPIGMINTNCIICLYSSQYEISLLNDEALVSVCIDRYAQEELSTDVVLVKKKDLRSFYEH